MNRFALLFFHLALFSGSVGLAQQNATLVNQVVGITGKSAALNGWQWSYTVGEVATATLAGTTRTLTQGFHQPEIAAFVSTYELDPQAWRLKVFPNPTADRLTVQYQAQDGRLLQATVYDLLGREHRTGITLDDPDGTSIDCAGLPAGVYLLHLRDPFRGAAATVRFIRL